MLTEAYALMDKIEYFFLDFGLPWTVAKLLPYFLLLFLSSRIVIFFFRKWVMHPVLLWGLGISLSILPAGAYFYFYPVYEGDVFDTSIQMKSTLTFPKEKTFNILALPDCPYCKQTIPYAEKLVERNPNIRVRYMILAENKNQTEGLASLLHVSKHLYFDIETDLMGMSNVTLGGYPSFVLSENGKIVKVWRSETFGTRAFDAIESFFE